MILFKMVDAAGGAVTGATVSVTVDGQAGTGTVTEVGDGWYRYAFGTGEGAQPCVVKATATLCQAVEVVYDPTLVSRLSEQRAANLDNLDATVSSRLATSAYVVPANSDIAAIKAKTDNLAFTSGRVNAKLDVIVESQIYQAWNAAVSVDSRLTGQRAANLDNLDATVSSRLAADAYVYPANDDIAAIKAKTDKLQFAGNDVKATLDGEQVIVSQNNDKTGYTLAQAYDAAKVAASQSSVDAIHAKLTTQRAANLDNLDAAVTSRLAASEYVAPANSDIAAIKAATDRIRFNSSDDVIATTDGEVVAVDIDGDALAVAVDSRLSQTHGSGAWGAAMPEDVTITHQSLDTYGNAIGTTWPYAIISVYLESDDYREQKLRQGVANPDGTFAINIAAGATYRIVFTKDTEGEREAVVNV